MRGTHEFFRNAAEERRTALVGFAITRGESTLQKLVVSELPMSDSPIPPATNAPPYTAIKKAGYHNN